ncbi:MAG: ECF subfamily RNA polymerase sigma factor [Saprospiraceae bacterium]|nr:MAG: ECF subfamily RNA polymerase sigma factor [Saprospiraceae bacterium]
MFSNIQLNWNITKKEGMSSSHRTVSAEKMQEEWLEIQAAQDNPALFRPLYNRYYEPIFRFVLRRTADEMLSADLCSQIFLKAMQRLASYNFRGVPFSAWLYRIASNEVAQHYRASNKSRVVSIEDTNLGDMAEEMDEESNELLYKQLIGALDDLKANDLQLVELRFFEQRPFKEIADILGMTESNAKVKTYRILERLKKKLTP